MAGKVQCMKHPMGRAVAYGWFVCYLCGILAGCPGCVEVPETMRVHWCREHGHLAALDGMATRTIWATKESAR
jgi:hypothetical protein